MEYYMHARAMPLRGSDQVMIVVLIHRCCYLYIETIFARYFMVNYIDGVEMFD